jgi:hypothetical protein
MIQERMFRMVSVLFVLDNMGNVFCCEYKYR